PKCRARVFEHGMSYVCENAVGAGRRCDFRSGKIILQQEVAPEQMRKLLAEGRTDLLTDFVSSRTRRKFKAYLVLGPDGKVGFAFEPRAAKKAPTKTASAARTGRARGRDEGAAVDAGTGNGAADTAAISEDERAGAAAKRPPRTAAKAVAGASASGAAKK